MESIIENWKAGNNLSIKQLCNARGPVHEIHTGSSGEPGLYTLAFQEPSEGV